MKARIGEDGTDVVEALSLCINLLWPEVVAASTTDAASSINSLKTDFSDIIIHDRNLPESDGFHVLQEIRSFPHIPMLGYKSNWTGFRGQGHHHRRKTH